MTKEIYTHDSSDAFCGFHLSFLRNFGFKKKRNCTIRVA